MLRNCVIFARTESLICKICNKQLTGGIVRNFQQCAICGIHYNLNAHSKNETRRLLSNMMLSACSSAQKMQKRIDNANLQLDELELYMSPGKLYDVGAAGGFVMKAAQDRQWEVYGNEISLSAVQWARRVYGIDIFHGFIEESPCVFDTDFDLAVFWNTLEHMIDPVETLKIVSNMLKLGGYIHIRVPIKEPKDIEKFCEHGHTVEFNPSSLVTLGNINKMSIISESYLDTRIPCMDLLWRKE